MSFESAAAIKPAHRGKLRELPNSSNAPAQLRIAEHPVRDRIQGLLDLASSLMRETEILARDKVFNEASAQLRTPDVAEGIDFYKEVERFETELIKLALEQAGRSQARAARLLGIRPTTLNSKIKMLGIEY